MLPLARSAPPTYVSNMSEAQPAVAEIAALVGNPARANILMALIDGRALTASELAYIAGVSPQTTSEHLAMLREANLLSMTKQGRRSYFRLGSPKVAQMIEGIMVVAADGPQRYRPRWNGDDRLRTARTCYDHIAGRLGVALTDTMTRRKHVVLSEDGGLLTRTGEKYLADFGVVLAAAKAGAHSAGRAWIGASGDRIWPALSAPPSLGAVSTSAGSRVSATRGRCRFPPKAKKASRRYSGFRFRNCRRNLKPRGRGGKFPRRARGRRAHQGAHRPSPCSARRGWRPIRRADRPARRSR